MGFAICLAKSVTFLKKLCRPRFFVLSRMFAVARIYSNCKRVDLVGGLGSLESEKDRVFV